MYIKLFIKSYECHRNKNEINFAFALPYEIKNVTVAFPKNTFYNDFYLDFKVENDIAIIHKPRIPLDKSYTLTFDISKYSY